MPDKFTFAKRTDWALTSNRIAQALSKLRSANVDVIDLTESNPTRCGFDYPAEEILKPLAAKVNLRYEPQPQGHPEVRAVIAHYYQTKGFEVPAENIFLTASTSEAYSYLFRLLVNPQERILFPQPSYPLFQFLGDLNDVRLDFYPFVYQKEWRIDSKNLKKLIRSDTKAIVLVNPNNPTGSFIKKDEQDMLNALCQQKNIPIICDEVFWDFAFDKSKHRTSFAGNKHVLTFTLGGLSKTLALPQMKLSWIILSGPPGAAALARERLEMIADTYLSVNTPVQNALERWFSLREQIQGQIKERLQDNLDFLVQEISPASCSLLAPEGGWYAVLKIPGPKGEEELVLKLLREDHVFVHPGYFFDFPEEETHLVLSLLPLSVIFQKGVRRILKRILAATASMNSSSEIEYPRSMGYT